MPTDEFFEWLKAQPEWSGWAFGKPIREIRGLWERQPEDIKQQVLAIYKQVIAPPPTGEGIAERETPAGLPTETTLQDGRTVPVRWEDTEDYPATFDPETGREEPAIVLPI